MQGTRRFELHQLPHKCSAFFEVETELNYCDGLVEAAIVLALKNEEDADVKSAGLPALYVVVELLGGQLKEIRQKLRDLGSVR